jgi:hypothetical protein
MIGESRTGQPNGSRVAAIKGLHICSGKAVLGKEAKYVLWLPDLPTLIREVDAWQAQRSIAQAHLSVNSGLKGHSLGVLKPLANNL